MTVFFEGNDKFHKYILDRKSNSFLKNINKKKSIFALINFNKLIIEKYE